MLHVHGFPAWVSYPPPIGPNWARPSTDHEEHVICQSKIFTATNLPEQTSARAIVILHGDSPKELNVYSKQIKKITQLQTVDAPNHILEDMSASEQKHKRAKSLGWRWRLRELLTWQGRLVGDVTEESSKG